MTRAIQDLFDGALLGDVVESITGHDVSITRYLVHRGSSAECNPTQWCHSTHAYAGKTLLGTADVVWEGTEDSYAELLATRMKTYLNGHRARPVIGSYDPGSGILARAFSVESKKGLLKIEEKLFVNDIESLIKIVVDGATSSIDHNSGHPVTGARPLSNLEGADPHPRCPS